MRRECLLPVRAARDRLWFMRFRGRFMLAAVIVAVPLAAAAIWPARTRGEDPLTIATWNLEWLVSPATLHAARLACRQGRRSTLPCDVTSTLARDSADLARLASYASGLDADVIAFQEVENEAIARRVFGGYDICIAPGSGVQHAGFAVRRGIAHRCGPVVDALSVDGRTRSAMALQLLPAGPDGPIELLAVHLKSGCSRDPLESDLAACLLLQQQATLLGEWIAARSAAGVDFIVLGDFNRVPPQSPDDAFWQLVQVAGTGLLATHLPFSNCFMGQPYSAFIDHMLFSSGLAGRVVPDSARHVGFSNADAVRYHLTDHCPVSISLRSRP